MYDKFGQFIDGKWQKSEKGETYPVIDPATEEIIGNASKASKADVEKAIQSAKKGLDAWQKVSAWERAKIIRKVADLMRPKAKVFAKWMTLETGKPLIEGEVEVQRLGQALGLHPLPGLLDGGAEAVLRAPARIVL